MKKYLLICPECGGGTVAADPDAMVWEACPSCYKHTWDQFDVKMAEPIRNNQYPHRGQQAGLGAAATH